MIILKAFLAFFLAGTSLFAAFPTEISGQMLLLLHRGEINQAFANYLEYATHEEHDFSLLQQAGIRLLEQGINSNDSETQLMCLFGAGVANSPELLSVLEKGIHATDQKMQLIALNYLSKQQDDVADQLILEALSSPFLLTRLECCYQLAQKNHPAALAHLQSLMVKVPSIVRAFFPQIAVHLEGENAHKYLRQLLTDADIQVRIEAILAVAKRHRDDFLPQIRILATQIHHAQQESCALALGELKDTESIPYLKTLVQSPRKEVKLAAAIALFELGEVECLQTIEQEAQQGNLFAIHALGKLHEGKQTLLAMANHPDRDIRLNVHLSLLQLGEKGTIEEFLFSGKGDFGFTASSSAGHGLKAWKTIPSHHQNTKGYPGIIQQTLALREKILTQCLELPETQFLTIARRVIAEKQTELIPLLVTLLENKRSEEAIALLKEGQQKAGEPLIRIYCTLALYRLQQEGPYEEQLIQWARLANDQNMIQFREEETFKHSFSNHYTLTPEETSRLLVETFEALAQAQNRAGIEFLVHTIAYGNPKNRYALAGLLIRTTE